MTDDPRPASRTSERSLWPEIRPFREDFLPVGPVHTIRYALYGNPQGHPVFFLHGGPGGGSDDDDARWFDPVKFLVITHDQRGSGRSTPRAEIAANTTPDLVADIERLRRHLEIPAPLSLFAGSWGTTLALLYAEEFPDRVARLILRGVFTCTWAAQDWFYSASGAALFSPVAWERLNDALPPGPGRIQERIHRLLEEADAGEREKWCRLLAEYEYSFFDIPPAELDALLGDVDSYWPEMRLNMHYQAHRFFLADRQILDRADRIRHIPLTLIHGTRDLVCPPALAWELHRRLPASELILVDGAGHLSSDPGIRQALLAAVDRWK